MLSVKSEGIEEHTIKGRGMKGGPGIVARTLAAIIYGRDSAFVRKALENCGDDRPFHAESRAYNSVFATWFSDSALDSL
jgi:hypothetical protein